MAEPQHDGEETVDESVDSSGIDWSGLSDMMEPGDEDAFGASEPSEPVNEEPETEAGEEPPQDYNDLDAAPEPEPAPEPEVPPEPEEPEPQAAQAPEPQPEPQPQEPPAPQQPDPQEMQRLRDQWVGQVAQRYQLSDEDQNNLITDPNSVLPQLAANLHAQVYEEVLQAVGQMVQQSLPSYLERWSSQREQSRQGEDAFFDKWPELRDHKDRVMQIAQVYRSVNPQAAMEQFIQDVGVQTWMALGLDPGKLAQKLQPRQAPPPQPQQPRQPRGYAPAPPNPAPPPQQPGNPFSDMAEEWFKEDM
jgi:outer membrane biosynthesis protein TonB